MSISAIGNHAAAPVSVEPQKPAAAPPPSTHAAAPNDTVSISPAAHKAAGAGDVDHDGDRH